MPFKTGTIDGVIWVSLGSVLGGMARFWLSGFVARSMTRPSKPTTVIMESCVCAWIRRSKDAIAVTRKVRAMAGDTGLGRYTADWFTVLILAGPDNSRRNRR